MDVNARDAAAIFAVDARTVARWVKDGCPSVKAGRERRFPLGELVRWYVEREVARKVAAMGDADPEYRAARAEKMRTQAERERIALARERREFIAVKDAAEVTGRHFSALRAALLQLPSRFAPQVVGTKTLTEAARALDGAVDELMAHLSSEDFVREVFAA